MSTTNEQSKEEFMAACLKDHDQATCEKMWNDAKAGTDKTKDKGYAEVVADNEKLKLRVDRLEAQLRQSNALLQRVNDLKKAEDAANKERLTIDIMNNSKYTKDMLVSKPYEELKIIADALENTEKGFASVATDAADTHRKQERKLTVGQWNPDTKQWEGGA